MALRLAFDCYINIDMPIGFNELKKVEFIKDYQIIVINGDLMNEFDYVGQFKDNKIVLYLKEGHYDFVKSILEKIFLTKRIFVLLVSMIILYLKIILVMMSVKNANKESVDWKKKIKLFATSVVLIVFQMIV